MFEIFACIYPYVYDLILIHPPSVLNFREKMDEFAPVSEMVPSTPIFEMFPIGFLSMMSNLCPSGYRVKVENIAAEMLRNNGFNLERRIESLETSVFGIDLHWLPHVHGAISIAKILKKIRPDVQVLMGGISATYYRNEIMEKLPFVDAVMLGDTTEPFISRYIDAVQGKGKMEDIPNLIWRENGRIRYNRVIPPEYYIDSVKLDYGIFLRNCIKEMEILPNIPYNDWIKSPAAMTFIQKGCHNNCLMCGGSNFSYKNFLGRRCVSLRPVKNVIDDLLSIQENLGVPVYISGDIYQAGPKYRKELLRGIKENGIDLPFLLEIFYPAPLEFYYDLSKNLDFYAIEISPESSSEDVRIANNKFFTNFALEKNMYYAKKHGARKMDIFFSIGLSRQEKSNIHDDYTFARKYQDIYGPWIHFFISPIVPFVDPGSLAFEMHEKYGYRIFARTLMDHYYLLENSRHWTESLNYETIWLSRREIGEISNEMSSLFSTLREDYGKDDLYWVKDFKIKFPLNIFLRIYSKFT
ncbi:MAG: TIGR04190 family B12-binding domain/radical SAM domain protein [Aciduliprofundum sp.]|nr:MAG: TIGR04190 family B12-binding domain/radical SAM domain protein [Aciduliprofundum sp.]